MQEQRSRYFDGVISHIRKSPTDFPPDPANRKKRVLEELERVVPPPPRELTKEEIKAQEQKDRQIKNWLKLRLNPIMEAIKQKYRRFKKPVIEYDLIKHLLDPQPPPEVEIVVSDIPPQPVHERFMIYFDDADEQGRVRDTHTNKTYYNLDIDVIEERLSNGFYCTSKQFLKDLEHIRYDADISGDKERKLKANEMLTNAEVFIADVEMDAGFVAQCEDMYRRQEKKKADKRAKQARKAKALQDAHEAATRLISSSNGRLSKSKTGSPDNNESFSNGVNPLQIQPEFHQSGVVALTEHDSQSSGHATGFQTPHSQTNSHLRMESPWSHIQSQGPVSRAPTQLTLSSAPGASVGVTAFNTNSVILNYASTTTSGQRTSDGTNFNSQQRSGTHSHSNGTHNSNLSNTAPSLTPYFPNFDANFTGDSQLPDTQSKFIIFFSPMRSMLLILFQVVPSSGSDIHSSQSILGSQSTPRFSLGSQAGSLSQVTQSGGAPHAPPVFELPGPRPPKLTIDEVYISTIHHKLCENTSGYSVEQLEQVNAAMMDAIWRARTLWNRDEVAAKALEAFEYVDENIRELQRMLTASASF